MPSRLLSRYAPMSVRGWVAAMIAVAMLPAFAFSMALINRNNKSQEAVLSTLAVLAAKAKAESIDRLVGGMITTMKVFSTSRSLRNDDLQDFYDEATAALGGSINFMAVASDPRTQVLNTEVPYGQKLLPLQESALYRAALETGQPQVSGAVFAKRAQAWAFIIAMPIEKPTTHARLLLMGQQINDLSAIFASGEVNGDWEATLVDRDGVVLASTVAPADVGKPFFLPTAASENGNVELLTADGKSFDVVSQRSNLTGWSVKIWADSDKIRGPVYRAYWMLVLGGLAMMAVATFIAYFLGRQIAASVRNLANDANRLGLGEDVQDRTSPITELTAVSHALAEASQRRRASENEIRFLMREVAHRSKNQLTVISSIAKQSGEGAASVEDFTEDFQQRIHGLSRSTDLLLAGGNSGVDLGELLRSHVEPFRPEQDAALTLDGPPFRLAAQAAQMLGLVFHELATNAAKYGAFSAPNGKVAVSWTVNDGQLAINWRERGSVAVEPAEKRGFGTRLLVRTVGTAMRGEVRSDWHADGIEVKFSMPLEGLRQLDDEA